MGRVHRILFSVFCVVGVLSSADRRPDFSGDWKLDLEHSRNDSGAKLEYVSMTMNIRQEDEKLRIAQQVTSPNYSRTIEMDVTTDGVEHKFTAMNQPAVASAHWEGEKLVTDYRRLNPALNATGTVLRTVRKMVLKNDGKTIDATTEVTFNGQRNPAVSGHEIWEKQ